MLTSTRRAQILEKTASHANDKCMRCSAPPTRECRWAEGAARAWFCDKHWAQFKSEHGPDSKMGADIDCDRAVKNGRVGAKYGQ